jgi:hypothetical protein
MGNWARLLMVVLAAVSSLATSMEDDYRPDAALHDGGDGDGGSAVTYEAAAYPTAMDRIVIVKADPYLDICAGVRLVHPGESMAFGISAPDTWSVELAYVTQDAYDCAAVPFPVDTVMATGGSGGVTWSISGGDVYPSSVDIDATLTFTPQQDWVPDSVRMIAEDVPVQQ